MYVYHILVAEIAHEGMIELPAIIVIAQKRIANPIKEHLPSSKIT